MMVELQAQLLLKIKMATGRHLLNNYGMSISPILDESHHGRNNSKFKLVCKNHRWLKQVQESRAVAGNPRDAAVIFDP